MLIKRENKEYGIRISSLALFAECPEMFLQAQLWETEQTDAMRNGKLQESYVFGFKNEDEKKLLEGRKKPATLQQYKDKAEKLKRYFKDVQSWERMYAKVRDRVISGEYDAFGDILHNEEYHRGLGDLKNTGDIFKIWDDKEQKYEFIQAVGYNWLRKVNGLDIVPFIYVITQDKTDDFIVRTIKVDVTEKDVLWFDSLVNKAIDYLEESDLGFKNYNTERCKGRTYKESACAYCTKCAKGIEFLTNPEDINFSDLLDPLELKVNESKLFDQVKEQTKKTKTYDPKLLEDCEVQESDIDDLIKTDLKELTYMQDEFKDTPITCRGCFKKTLERGMTECPACKVKIKLI